MKITVGLHGVEEVGGGGNRSGEAWRDTGRGAEVAVVVGGGGRGAELQCSGCFPRAASSNKQKEMKKYWSQLNITLPLVHRQAEMRKRSACVRVRVCVCVCLEGMFSHRGLP